MACRGLHRNWLDTSSVGVCGSSPCPLATQARPYKPFSYFRTSRENSIITLRAQSADVLNSTTPPSSKALWDAFAAAVSGEWDGIIATFDRDGEAQQLPEYYVPQAYRDWDVKLYDWQSQCSMIADAMGLRYGLRRLMPTVGCEADAIAFTEEQQEMFPGGSSAPYPTLCSNGSFTHPPVGLLDEDISQTSAEHAFPLDAPGQRLRIVHSLRRMGSEQTWKLMSIELHRERYDSPFNGRRELAGCGGGMDFFATSARLDADNALLGEWRASGVRFTSGADSMELVQNLIENEPWSRDLLPCNSLIGLPQQTWSACQVEGDDVNLAAGVAMEDGRIQIATQTVRGGKLERAELLTLVKAV